MKDEVNHKINRNLIAEYYRGSSYLQAQDFSMARAVLEPSYEEAIRTLGPDDPLTLTIAHGLGFALTALKDHARAKAIHSKNLEALTRLNGPDDTDTLDEMLLLALAFFAGAEVEEAKQLLLKLLDASERVRGRDHPLTLQVTGCLAHVFEKAGELDAALSMAERTLEARRRVLGKGHPDYRLSVETLADVKAAIADEARRKKRASSSSKNSWKILRHRYAPGGRRYEHRCRQGEYFVDPHQAILGSLAASGEETEAGLRAGRREAEDLREELARNTASLGPSHPDSLRARLTLAVTLSLSDELEEARDHYVWAMAYSIREMGTGMPPDVLSLCGLSSLFTTAGDPAASVFCKKLAATYAFADESAFWAWGSPDDAAPGLWKDACIDMCRDLFGLLGGEKRAGEALAALELLKRVEFAGHVSGLARSAAGGAANGAVPDPRAGAPPSARTGTLEAASAAAEAAVPAAVAALWEGTKDQAAYARHAELAGRLALPTEAAPQASPEPPGGGAGPTAAEAAAKPFSDFWSALQYSMGAAPGQGTGKPDGGGGQKKRPKPARGGMSRKEWKAGKAGRAEAAAAAGASAPASPAENYRRLRASLSSARGGAALLCFAAENSVLNAGLFTPKSFRSLCIETSRDELSELLGRLSSELRDP
ncbi:MAG: tetratricopeptide repeat protein, partial [Deltaproteobacteria bacterium]|nr:tetratricopeptide repeat protein [Deltaproteobacteria bacterium]